MLTLFDDISDCGHECVKPTQSSCNPKMQWMLWLIIAVKLWNNLFQRYISLARPYFKSLVYHFVRQMPTRTVFFSHTASLNTDEDLYTIHEKDVGDLLFLVTHKKLKIWFNQIRSNLAGKTAICTLQKDSTDCGEGMNKILVNKYETNLSNHIGWCKMFYGIHSVKFILRNHRSFETPRKLHAPKHLLFPEWSTKYFVESKYLLWNAMTYTRACALDTLRCAVSGDDHQNVPN